MKKSEGTKVNEKKAVKGSIGSHADDRSFSRLFGFITGRNEATQKIPMTTPVFMTELDSNRTIAFGLNNVHLAEVIKFAIRELNKAYGNEQGTA